MVKVLNITYRKYEKPAIDFLYSVFCSCTYLGSKWHIYTEQQKLEIAFRLCIFAHLNRADGQHDDLRRVLTFG